MKYIFSTLVVVVLFCFTNGVSAQTSSKQTTTMKTAEATTQSWSVSYEVDNEKLATKINTQELTEEVKDLKYYNKFIKALQYKREFVLNDPKEKAIALESGWFTQIDEEIEKAMIEREKLIEQK